jgi:hypothetical protein
MDIAVYRAFYLIADNRVGAKLQLEERHLDRERPSAN